MKKEVPVRYPNTTKLVKVPYPTRTQKPLRNVAGQLPNSSTEGLNTPSGMLVPNNYYPATLQDDIFPALLKIKPSAISANVPVKLFNDLISILKVLFEN